MHPVAQISPSQEIWVAESNDDDVIRIVARSSEMVVSAHAQ